MQPTKKQGLLIVLSGPSGVGKGTVCSYLKAEYQDIYYSVSATTRQARIGEKEGVNYFFLSESEFLVRRDRGDFLEWAEVYGHYYGTPRSVVEDQLAQGKDVILEIDIQGAKKVKNGFPQGVFIFLMPPSKAELEKRIVGRATDSAETIKRRLACVDSELIEIKTYDYAVTNDRVADAVERITAIMTAEKCRVSRILKSLNI